MTLPSAMKLKWQRLLTYNDGDVELLLSLAIDLLWEKFGKDIEKNNHVVARLERKVADAKKRLRTSNPADSLALVGTHLCKVLKGGEVTLPLAWYRCWDFPTKLYLLENKKEKCLQLFDANVFAHCYKKTQRKAKPVIVDSKRRIRVDAKSTALLGGSEVVKMIGSGRYVKLLRIDV